MTAHTVDDDALWAQVRASLERDGLDVEVLSERAAEKVRAWIEAPEAQRASFNQIHHDETR
jgi:hypothetical protein